MYCNTAKGEALAKEVGAYAYMECSALSQQGLKELFDTAARLVIKNLLEEESEQKPPQGSSCCLIL